MPGHTSAVTALAPSPDGNLLATTGVEGTLWVRVLRDGAERVRVPIGRPGIYQVAWSPDEKRLAVSLDFQLQIRSAADGALLDTAEVGIKGAYGVAFSPDGRYLADAGADRRIRVWDLG